MVTVIVKLKINLRNVHIIKLLIVGFAFLAPLIVSADGGRLKKLLGVGGHYMRVGIGVGVFLIVNFGYWQSVRLEL